MKSIVLSGKAIISGIGSLEYLRNIKFQRAFIITGGSSMIKSGVIDRIKHYMEGSGKEMTVYPGIRKNPTFKEVLDGLEVMRLKEPDLVIAVGGGSAMDAAKAMVLFYEFPYLNFENVLQEEIPPERKKTTLICIPSTSGTGSEVTIGTVVTNVEEGLKVPIMRPCLRPDIAILDADITMTMPAGIAAETGMDALTHAVEAFINHNLDDFDEALCRHAIKGILKWLPVSCEKATLESREKVHNYQCMAGIAFANVGLGMVHGLAHSFGAIYNLAHGVTNAIILPFALDYNKRNKIVAEKLEDLSNDCKCEDIIEEIKKLKKKLGIPLSFKELGISEEAFIKDFDLILDHSMLGATMKNPVPMTKESMAKMVKVVYYGTGIDF
jgi:hypothetical protein